MLLASLCCQLKPDSLCFFIYQDIRNSSGNIRSLTSTTLFPQSIRTSTTKSHRVSSAPASVDMNGSMISSKNGASEGERKQGYFGN